MVFFCFLARLMSKRYRNESHLNCVRELPCCVCWSNRSDAHRDAHHLLRGVIRGVGMKAPDSFVVPLCHKHHMELHASGNEEEFFKSYSIHNPVSLARKLYENTGNYARMLKILRRNGGGIEQDGFQDW